MRKIRVWALHLLGLCLMLPGAVQAASREYKLLLDPAPFSTAANSLERAAQTVAEALRAQGFETRGHFSRKAQRSIQFFDTPGFCALRRAGFILRLRGEQDLTLKQRTPGGVSGGARGDDVSRFKAEEDVSPPAQISLSDAWSRHALAPRSLAELSAIFSALAGHFQQDAPLQTVAAQVFQEQNYELLRVRHAKQSYPLEAATWVDQGGRLVAVEISFRFEESPAGRETGMRLFAVLQHQAGLRLSTAQSKTDLAYRAANGGFCTP